jgi:hypothetical protein
MANRYFRRECPDPGQLNRARLHLTTDPSSAAWYVLDTALDTAKARGGARLRPCYLPVEAFAGC